MTLAQKSRALSTILLQTQLISASFPNPARPNRINTMVSIPRSGTPQLNLSTSPIIEKRLSQMNVRGSSSILAKGRVAVITGGA